MISFLRRHYLKLAAAYLMAFLLYSVHFLYSNKHLPPPFYFDAADTLMDYYNINWRSHTTTIYTEWRSFYSTPNVYLARLLTPERCLHTATPFDLRACDGINGLYFFAGLLLLNAYLLYKILATTPGKWWWMLVMMISFPVLHGLERGNYIFLGMAAISFYVLAEGVWLKALATSLAICSKAYLLVVAVPLGFRYGAKAVVTSFVIAFGLNFLFAQALNDPNWIRIPINLFSFGSAGVPYWLNDAMAPTTPRSYASTVSGIFPDYPALVSFVALVAAIGTIIVVGRAWLFAGITRRYHEQDEKLLLLLTLVVILLITSSPSYYAMVLLYPLVAYALSKGLIHASAKFIFLLLLLPYPFPLIDVFSTQMPTSFWPGEDVFITASLTVQGIAPPLLLLSFFYILTNSIAPKESPDASR